MRIFNADVGQRKTSKASQPASSSEDIPIIHRVSTKTGYPRIVHCSVLLLFASVYEAIKKYIYRCSNHLHTLLIFIN